MTQIPQLPPHIDVQDDDLLVVRQSDNKDHKVPVAALSKGNVRYVQTIDDLRAVNGMREGQATEIVSTGRAGLFRWQAGDLSAECAADPMMGIYVPPAGETGSSGAWVRVWDGVASVLWFGANPDDPAHDDWSAFQYGHRLAKTLLVPDGSGYYISAPIVAVNSHSIGGEAEIVVKDTGAQIYAPNGFLVNSGAARVLGSWKNLYIRGEWSAGAPYSGRCFDGRFGGLMSGLFIEGFSDIVYNDFAYLLQVDACRFNHAHRAFNVATVNGTNITRSWFGSSIDISIDFLGIDLGPSAVATGFPFVVSGCNFNIGTTTQIISRTRGQAIFTGNYVEAFNAVTSPRALFEHLAGRFDRGSFVFKSNYLNGQGRTDSLAVHIYGNNSAGTTGFSGEISNNYIAGFSAPLPVKIGGEVVSGASSEVQGVRIFDNQTPSAEYVDYSGVPANLYDAFVDASYNDPLDISGSAYVRIPFADTGLGVGDQLASNGDWTVRRGGLYRVTATVVHRASGAGVSSAELGIFMNGQVTAGRRSVASVVPGEGGGNWYANGMIDQILNLSRGDVISIRARSGAFIVRASLIAVRVCEKNY